MFIREIRKYPEGLLDQIFINEEIEYTEEMKVNLENAIEQLSETEKKLIILRFKERRLIKDIGSITKISQGTVSSRIQSAVIKLRHPIIKRSIEGRPNGSCINYELENFPLSIRTYNALKRNGIRRLDEIESLRQLNRMRSIGKSSIQEIMNIVKENGLYLRH